jgi:hypothetical protein
MNKILIILSLVLLASCGLSQEEKTNIAAVTCSIMSETRNMDAAVRVEKMNDAREKIGGEPFLRGDDAIQEAFELGLCQELVLGTYDETLQSLKERERLAWEAGAEDRKIAAEKQRIAAEKQRLADSKPTVKEEFHLNGKLKTRINYSPKSYGGREHGLYESYDENGQLQFKENWKHGWQDGLQESYHENGQLSQKGNYKDGRRDGLQESYHENGKLRSKTCYKYNQETDMSYCKK